MERFVMLVPFGLVTLLLAKGQACTSSFTLVQMVVPIRPAERMALSWAVFSPMLAWTKVTSALVIGPVPLPHQQNGWTFWMVRCAWACLRTHEYLHRNGDCEYDRWGN